jgi:hypothetical protein
MKGGVVMSAIVYQKNKKTAAIYAYEPVPDSSLCEIRRISACLVTIIRESRIQANQCL